MTNHNIQCFHGVQEKNYDAEKTEEYNTGKMKFNKIIAHHQIDKENLAGEVPQDITNGVKTAEKPASRGRQQRKNLHLAHRPSDEMDLLIETVNESDLTWKADVCKYQKHHAKYGKHCDSLNLAQTKSSSDDDEEKKKFGDKKDSDFAKTLE
jgi:hypothetical protein